VREPEEKTQQNQLSKKLMQFINSKKKFLIDRNRMQTYMKCAQSNQSEKLEDVEVAERDAILEAMTYLAFPSNWYIKDFFLVLIHVIMLFFLSMPVLIAMFFYKT
jgi:hypothetical protein